MDEQGSGGVARSPLATLVGLLRWSAKTCVPTDGGVKPMAPMGVLGPRLNGDKVSNEEGISSETTTTRATKCATATMRTKERANRKQTEASQPLVIELNLIIKATYFWAKMLSLTRRSIPTVILFRKKKCI